MYGYRRPSEFNPVSLDIARRREGLLVTNKYKLGQKLLGKIATEIKENDALHERLKPERKDEGTLGRERIETRNGCEMNLRSADSTARGLHPDWIIIDDYGDNNWIYSKEQRDKAIENFYGDIMKTIERGGTINIVGCVSMDSTIITRDGLRKIGNLCPVENYKEKGLYEYEIEVLGKNGWNKTSHYWCNGLTKTKKITLKGGYELECSLIHPLWKMNENGCPDWCESKNLKVGDWIAVKDGYDFDGEKIDLTEFYSNYNVTYKHKNIKIHNSVDRDLAYLLGLYVADGSFEDTGRITIAKSIEGIRKFLLEYGFVKGQDIKLRYNSKYLIDLMQYLGFTKATAISKHIPEKIFKADKETLKWFLQGMFDGDGGCYVDKDSSIQINYSSISKQLIYDLHNILMAFGIFSSIKERPPGISERVRGKHNLYRINIAGYDSRLFLEKIGFRFSGKSDKVAEDLLSSIRSKNSSYRRIPHQKDLIKKVRKEKPRRKRGEVSTLPPFHSQEVVSTNISRESLKIVSDWFVENNAKGEFTDQLIKNTNENLVYLPITKIEDSENYTVDFHIPNKHNFITNGIVSHNTPFQESDLYAYIRENDKTFKYFEYPAVMPDGTIVAPHRWNMEELEKEYETNGPLIFSREILVVPISDGSTIFPWDILEKSFIGMQDYRLVTNRDSFPIKFKFVSVGCDFAISGNIENADATVFSVWGVDDYENYWLLHIWRKQGASHNEQIGKLKEIERNFRPDEIVAESNGFQKVMLSIGREHGIKNITDFNTTGWNKKDLYEGLPSLAILFHQGRMRMPRGDVQSKEMTDWLCSEFNSITIKPDSGKLESAGQHDDGPMSAWLGIKCISASKDKDVNFVMM
jgi:intein/homing endonuclease